MHTFCFDCDGPQHPFVYGMQAGTLASGRVEDADRVQRTRSEGRCEMQSASATSEK